MPEAGWEPAVTVEIESDTPAPLLERRVLTRPCPPHCRSAKKKPVVVLLAVRIEEEVPEGLEGKVVAQEAARYKNMFRAGGLQLHLARPADLIVRLFIGGEQRERKRERTND